jgi:hypothetical protein
MLLIGMWAFSALALLPLEATAEGRVVKSCIELKSYMGSSGYSSLKSSSYTARYKIGKKVTDTVVTQYFMPDGSRFATYGEPGKGIYAYGYDRDMQTPIDLFCRFGSARKKAAFDSFLGLFTRSKKSASGSPGVKSRKKSIFSLSMPRYSLGLGQSSRGSAGRSGLAGWGKTTPVVILGFLGFALAGGLIFAALNGKGGALPNAPTHILVSMALPVLFVLISNYFGQQPKFAAMQGGLSWIMIILAGIVIFISGIFARRIWFSLFQSVLMWFVISFSDRIFELDRIGARLSRDFMEGRLDQLVYMSLTAAMAYGLFVGIINKFEGINTDLKVIFIR